MKETIRKANQYIDENREKVDQQYRGSFHLLPPIGWMNDPNGFVYFRGEYHLFYQFYPYDSVWGPMHWGHAKSKDLLHWEELPVALAPSESYDKDGCFSGSAIVKDDKLYLLYTGHVDDEEKREEAQCLAVSTDGITFEKLPTNPVIHAQHIEGNLIGYHVEDVPSNDDEMAIQFVDSIHPLFGEFSGSQEGFAILADTGRKMKQVVPTELQGKRLGLKTRNYVTASHITGQAGYSQYRYVGIVDIKEE